MNSYIDIQIIPDADMRANLLLNKIYTKFHKALVDLQSSRIGVSFPKYRVTLGNVIRVHGTHDELSKFEQQQWRGGLSGYCKVSPIIAVPQTVSYRNLSRKQSSMSPAKLRRLLKRGSIAEQEAKIYKAKMFAAGLDEPYLELESTSNGNLHRRYIFFGDLLEEPVQGTFDHFGLSKTATIPWF